MDNHDLYLEILKKIREAISEAISKLPQEDGE